MSSRSSELDSGSRVAANFAPLRLWLLLLLPCLASGLNSDGVLLLSFKYSILSDPLSVLGDWNYDDDVPCSWNGVTCIAFPGFNGATNTTTATDSRVISLVLPNAQLLGSIPPDLGLVDHLRHLDLSGNFLNGTLPESLFNASELRVLSLPNNEISGELPGLVGRLRNLQVLNLSDNALVGGVPGSLALLPNLTAVSLANNYLSGGLPGGGFDRLEVLDLSSNLVNGSLPPDLCGGSLRYLNLSYNRLDGDIPPELGSGIPAGATLDLSFNNLTGEVPQFKAFLSQNSASFAGNPDLCGRPLKNLCSIPSTLSDPPPNVSATTPPTLESPPAFAAIPRNPIGDSPGTAAADGGQGSQGGLRPAAIAAITVGDLAGIGLLFMVFLYVYHAKKKRKHQQQQEQSGIGPAKNEKGGKEAKLSAFSEPRRLNGMSWCLAKKGGDSGETSASSETEAEEEKEEALEERKASSCSKREPQQRATLVTVDGETELELETLLKASAYILGATASSIVYKAVLADGTALAVRRIGESGAVDKLKDFEAQVRGIAKLRHPNLLPLRGFYWGADEKLVIHDYATNGSLANISFSKKLGSSPFHLSWEARLGIARGVARGLAYLHDKKCVHGNLKPGNILLGADMEPWIGDFGLERLMSGDASGKSARHFGSKRSTQSLPELSPVAGASPCGAAGPPVPPYQAPESLKNLKPNAKWDVYSFGMVLLELVAGRVFSELELCQWNAGFVVEERSRVLRMADPALRGEVEGREEALLVCFKLGFACASLSPQRRPSMRDAAQVLDKMPSAAFSTSS